MTAACQLHGLPEAIVVLANFSLIKARDSRSLDLLRAQLLEQINAVLRQRIVIAITSCRPLMMMLCPRDAVYFAPVSSDRCSDAASSALSFSSLTTFLFFTSTRTVRSRSMSVSSCQFCIRDRVCGVVSNHESPPIRRTYSVCIDDHRAKCIQLDYIPLS